MIVAGLLVALIVVNVAYVLHLERKDRRHDEQVNRLLVHIQAPETAVAQAVAQTSHDLPAVHPDDDEDYWQAQQDALNRIARIESGS
jgi:hypothetical protein